MLQVLFLFFISSRKIKNDKLIQTANKIELDKIRKEIFILLAATFNIILQFIIILADSVKYTNRNLYALYYLYFLGITTLIPLLTLIRVSRFTYNIYCICMLLQIIPSLILIATNKLNFDISQLFSLLVVLYYVYMLLWEKKIKFNITNQEEQVNSNMN